MVAISLVAGGGGSGAPLSELVVQLGAAAMLVLLAAGLLAQGTGSLLADRRAALVCALVLAVPILQLVPLPPSVWRGLPGREVELAALDLVGAGRDWMPLSMTPSRTFASLLAMVPPVLVLLLVAGLGPSGRRAVLWTTVLVAIASVLLGALQLSAGIDGSWRLYAETHLTYLSGFQANRNAQADILHLAMLAAAVLVVSRPGGQRARALRAVLVGAWGLMALSVLLTGSRMGILLLGVSVPASLLIVRRELAAVLGGVAAKWIVGGAALGALGAFAALRLPVFERIAARFSVVDTTRQNLWTDTVEAISRTWPWGSGIGSFIPVFLSVESLETVDPSHPVRAHNDWLEFVLEAGLPGLIVIGSISALILLAAARRWRDSAGAPDRDGHLAELAFAAVGLLVIAVNSLVDYPLRSMSLACFAAISAAMAFPYPAGTANGASRP